MRANDGRGFPSCRCQRVLLMLKGSQQESVKKSRGLKNIESFREFVLVR